MASEPLSTDELLKAMERDDLEDRSRIYPLMKVIDYAKMMGEQPQLWYYYIRTRKLKKQPCPMCGNETISVEEANAFRRERDRSARARQGLPTEEGA